MSILIIGKIPPPIGGVTIHVKRLISHLQLYDDIEFQFLNINDISWDIIRTFFKYKIIHLHTSNSFFKLIFSFFCFIIRKKLIITYHGNIGRYNPLKNLCEILSIYFTFIPITINKQSYIKAKKINKKTVIIPAFIEQIDIEQLPFLIKNKTDKFINKFKTVLCTNASNVNYDKNGDEIYCGSDLIDLFGECKHIGLIFSDPSGEYYKFIKSNRSTPNNVLFITGYHSFVEIIKKTQGFIRATTTDGDALSVKEALILNKVVFASDCIDRPKGCLIFKTKNFNDLKQLILDENSYKNEKYYSQNVDSVKLLIDLYKIIQ